MTEGLKMKTLQIVAASLVFGALAVTTTVLQTPETVYATEQDTGVVYDYRVVHGRYDKNDFEDRGKTEFTDVVKKYMTQGWQPQGGVSIAVCVSDYEIWVLLDQAMVRRH